MSVDLLYVVSSLSEGAECFHSLVFSCATHRTYKEVIRWMILWQVLSLLTTFPIHYMLY